VSRAILVLNAGSSSVKYALYEAGDLAVICRGGIDLTGGEGRLEAGGPRAAALEGTAASPAGSGHRGAVAWLLKAIRENLPDIALAGAGHRVVHGGARFAAPVRVDGDVLEALGKLVALAPGHEPHNIAAIRAVAKAWPDLPQIACFDTAFHRTQPPLAQRFALPRALAEEGVLRYGFHGLSYEYIAGVLPEHAGPRAGGRVIVAHLGNGASMCAMRNRRSVATTMSYTALDGLVMATRCGALDPGVVLHLIREKGMSADAVADLLYNGSGLLGVSGISGDVRALEARDAPEAEEALDLFAYRAAREMGSLIAALGGLELLVFTDGIGEHSAAMRRRICERAAWTGIALDAAAHDAHRTRISTARSPVEILVIPTDEELVIARATTGMLLPAR
jgi:acetate kinase